MNVRAYFPDTGEYFYPTEKGPQTIESLITFYSILQGYILKGREFVIDHGSGINDVVGNEVYERDYVNVYFFEEGSENIEDCEIEVMRVVFDMGAFLIIDKEDLIFDLANFFVDEESFLVSIIDNKRYDEKESSGKDE